MGIREDFRAALLKTANATLGIRETSRNSSPDIDGWLKYVHLGPGHAWCAAWVASMHAFAANAVNAANPCPKSASVLTMWSLTLPECIATLPYPGCVYFLDHGEGKGHCGIVVSVSPAGKVVSEISGNTNGEGSREGDGVYMHYGDPALSHNGRLMGFADYSELVPLSVGS